MFFYLVVFVVFLRLQKKKSFYFRKDFVKFKRFFFAFDVKKLVKRRRAMLTRQKTRKKRDDDLAPSSSAFGSSFNLRDDDVDDDVDDDKNKHKKKTFFVPGEEEEETTNHMRETFVLLFLIASISFSYVFAFSAKLGYGRETYRFLASEKEQYELELVSLSVVLLCVLFVFDGLFRFEGESENSARSMSSDDSTVADVKKADDRENDELKPSSFKRAIRNGALAFAAVLFVASATLSAKTYPQAPPTMFVCCAPMFVALCKRWFRSSTSKFLMKTASALIFSALGIALWLAFVVYYSEKEGDDGNDDENGLYWSEVKSEYMEDAGCPTDTEENDECLAAYIMWFTPMLAILACTLFSCFTYVLGLAVREENSTTDTRNKTKFAARAFAFTFALAGLGIWISASLSGGAEELSTLLLSFSMAALFVLGVGTVFALGGAENAKQKALESSSFLRATSKVVTETHVDAFRAIVLSTPLTLLIPIMLFLSVINQFVRRFVNTSQRGFSMDEKLHRGWFTYRVSAFLSSASEWRWTAIFINLHYWICLLVSLNVLAGTFTVVFLSWLRVKLAKAGFAFTYVVFSLVGLAMFLIPVIPGIPVYLTGGILLTDESSVNFFKKALSESGETPSETKSYVCALLAASGACFVVKLLAVAMQQKLIGERLGKRVWVRQTVGINTNAMRAAKLVLSKRGFSKAKVALLVGGPDWPTSVLTGILNLNVFEMLLGTVPVIFPVITTVLAGAFMLKQGTNSMCGNNGDQSNTKSSSNTSGLWSSIADVALLVTAVVQGTCLLLGIYYVEKTSRECKEELAQLPYDEEVMHIEEETKREKEIKENIGNFFKLEPRDRTLLVFSTAICLLSFWVIQLGPTFIGEDEAVLKEYQLTDCVSHTLKGRVWTVVTSIGWLAILAFIFSMFTLWTFNARLNGKVQDVLDEEYAIENGIEDFSDGDDENNSDACDGIRM